jgi:hypothetical protein
MDEREKEMLRNIQVMTEENNKILKKMNRRAILGTASRLLYWVVIIAVAFGAYYFIEPYVNKVADLYKLINSGTAGIDLKNVQNISDAIGKVIPVK